MAMRMAVTSRATLVAVVESRQLCRVVYAALSGCDSGNDASRFEVHSDGCMVIVVPQAGGAASRLPS